GQVISNLRVGLALNHTQVSDLRLTLVAPDGTQVVLSDRNPQGPGFAGQIQFLPGPNFDNVIFDDNAAVGIAPPNTVPAVAGPPAPFKGSFRPNQALSALNGKSLNGTWTLRVEDLGTGNVG